MKRNHIGAGKSRIIAVPVAALACWVFAAGMRMRPRFYAQPAHTVEAASAQIAGRIQFSYGGNVAQVPAQIVDSLALVPVRVNGSQPSWFLLSTAQPVSAIDDVRAVAVGLYSPSAHGTLPKSFANVRLEFPGMRVSLPTLVLGSYGDLSSRIGHVVQGVLGADVLSRLIVEINYARESVRFYNPASFRYSGKGLRLPLTIAGGAPAISGKVAIPHRGDFRGLLAISTGETAPLRFAPQFAEAHSLADLPIRTLPFPSPDAATDTGFRERIGRIHELQFGKIKFTDPLAIFPANTRNRPKDKNASKSRSKMPVPMIGALGGAILDRFTLILDFPGRQLIFEPNQHLPDLFLSDMSGLTIIAIPPAFDRFEVARVEAKSPAAKAGVAVGDMIEQADGNPSSNYTLDELRALLREPGTTHTLTLLRNGKTFEVTLNLKPLV